MNRFDIIDSIVSNDLRIQDRYNKSIYKDAHGRIGNLEERFEALMSAVIQLAKE